jgi:hypothetical protein
LNAGSLKLPEEALLRLVRLIKTSGLRAKPMFSVKFDSSEIPISGDRAFGAYVPPVKEQSSGKYGHVFLIHIYTALLFKMPFCDAKLFFPKPLL